MFAVTMLGSRSAEGLREMGRRIGQLETDFGRVGQGFFEERRSFGN
jgi:hypothetical protein